MHTVVIGIVAVHVGAGSRCILVEVDQTAVVGVFALATRVELADSAVPVGLAVSAVIADNDGLDIVGFADTAAQGSLVMIVDIAA